MTLNASLNMASSASRDPESNNAQDKSDNPFIKFRRFADDKIGSLLQGIIGLPSALTKSSQPRWAEFDEDMRRRDDLQVRQKEMRDAEAQRARKSGQDEEVAIPVKKSPEWTTRSASGIPEHSQSYNTQPPTLPEKDIPLYAPVTKSLFAQLRQLNSHDGGWDEEEPPAWDRLSEIGMEHSEQKGSNDSMSVLRDTIYNDLNTSPLLRSNYSLLPYLLFSPYSPLKLSSATPYGSELIDAFEDLIRISQGRPMQSEFEGFLSRRPLMGIEPIHPRRSTTLALQQLGWIRRLQENHILQERETLTGRQAHIARAWQSFYQPAWPSLPVWLDVFPGYTPETEGHPETEQDMYDRFLNWASPPAAFEKAMGLLSRRAEDFMENQLKEIHRTTDEVKSTTSTTPSTTPTDTEESLPTPQTSEIYSSLPHVLQKVLSILDPTGTHNPTHQYTVPTEPEPEDLVSTTTTSERTSNQAGSVTTSITVVKRFTDGREVITKTTCVEDGGRVRTGDEEADEEEMSEVGEKSKEVKDKDKEVKQTKGWFWS